MNVTAAHLPAGILHRIRDVEWFRYDGSPDTSHVHAGESGRPDALDFRAELSWSAPAYAVSLIEYRPVGDGPWLPTGYAGRVSYDTDDRRGVGDDGDGYHFYPYKVTGIIPVGR